MNQPLNIANLIVGGMLMLSSAFALLYTRKRRELVRGFTYKQFVFGMIFIFVGGAVIAGWQFIFGT
jgi:LPXTG-motif cell wall-anchored protein